MKKLILAMTLSISIIGCSGSETATTEPETEPLFSEAQAEDFMTVTELSDYAVLRLDLEDSNMTLYVSGLQNDGMDRLRLKVVGSDCADNVETYYLPLTDISGAIVFAGDLDNISYSNDAENDDLVSTIDFHTDELSGCQTAEVQLYYIDDQINSGWNTTFIASVSLDL